MPNSNWKFEKEIQQTAENAAGGPVGYEGFVSVAEIVGEVSWKGHINLFESARGRVYAWVANGQKEPQFIAMLSQPPIDSPHAAVRAWLAANAHRGTAADNSN